MTEVEKLYELAGVEKIYIECPADYYGYKCDKSNWDDADCPCDQEVYPPFTAEKQIELIKWLAFRDYIAIVAYISGEYHSEHDKYNANENSLEGCLARLINNLWQDLTTEEQKQIREILK